jgi:hypothetical protein
MIIVAAAPPIGSLIGCECGYGCWRVDLGRFRRLDFLGGFYL